MGLQKFSEKYSLLGNFLGKSTFIEKCIYMRLDISTDLPYSCGILLVRMKERHCMRIKSFDELTIQDNFIFQKVMLKKPICKAVLERLLDISKPLQRFLDYVDGQTASDELLRDIESAVDEAKYCEAWREEYSMLSMDHYAYWKEGIAEGRAEGVVEGKTEVVIQMLRKQLSLEMIAEVTNFTTEEVTAIAKEHGLM